MFRILFILIGLFILLGGLHEAYEGWSNPEPKQMTVSDYVNSDHTENWVVLTDAKLNLMKGVMVTKGEGGKIKRLYLPIESEEFFQKEKISLLLDTTDEELLASAEEMRALSEGEQLKHFIQNRDKFLRNVELSGKVWSQSVMDSDHADDINRLISNIDDEYYVLDHGATADFTRGLIISMVALVILVIAISRKRKPAKEAAA